MELRQLRYFLMVAETLHFGRAAERLHIAQQPLSFQIKKLEEELGVNLFERTTRSVSLSPAGEALVIEVQAGLTRIERGVELAQRIARGAGGKIYIGYNTPTLYNVLPAIIRRFRERFPQFEVVMLELEPPEIERKILNEDIDIGFVLSLDPRNPELVYELIYQEPVTVALPKDHPLAPRATISLHELSDVPFVMYSRTLHPALFNEIIALCHLQGFRPIIRQEAATSMAVVSLVAAGLGVALVSSSLSEIRLDEVAYRLLIDPQMTIDTIVVWKEDREAPWLQALRRIAQEVALQGVPGIIKEAGRTDNSSAS